MNLIVFRCCRPITLTEFQDDVAKACVCVCVYLRQRCELMCAHESALPVEQNSPHREDRDKRPLCQDAPGPGQSERLTKTC